MRWQGALAVVAGAMWSVSSLAMMGAASGKAAPATAGTSGTAAAGQWGKATAIPGLHGAGGDSITCVSSGNCAAAEVTDSRHAIVASESKGHWGKVTEVPGLTALIKGGDLLSIRIACGTLGDCAVGGTWLGTRDSGFAFVASETNGKWAKAIRVPGLAALNTGKDEELTSLSCSTGGSCVGAGDYAFANPKGFDAFVVSERNGHWGQAMPVPGLQASGFARLRTLACTSAGNCSAGGNFLVAKNQAGFVVNEKNGTWGKAIEVPGLVALSVGGDSEVDQMTCPLTGNCVAGGIYTGNDGGSEAFVVSEKNGTWGKAIAVPGLMALNADGIADLQSISCISRVNCAAGGTYKDAKSAFQGYVVNEKNGTWGKAIEIPNLGRLNRAGDVQFVEVGCVASGNCVAGGDFSLGEDSDTNAFVAS
ncbi:MAG TPA: hypothetical protein VFI65_28045, partial [Streptosporangiaceae bacterium]|nr:hypothetical protein [Streptosporangiaceae bacterium]